MFNIHLPRKQSTLTINLTFVLWIIGFGLSHLIALLGWVEQGVAFLYLSLGFDLLILIIGFFVMLESMNWFDVGKYWLSISVALVFKLFMTWIASQIFDVNFYVTYQIVAFGQCLCNTTKS